MQPTTVPSPLLDRLRPTTGVTTEGSKHASTRLASVDAYRGFVMFLMMAEVLHLSGVARAFPDSAFWGVLAFNTTHVEWVGCSLHDLIQPSFSFLVGVALPFSIASRMAKGQSQLNMTGHALWRALLLILLGVFLRSVGRPQTNWTFEDTLTQIGLGYPILFLLGFRSPRVQWAALAVILLGYWAAWAMYPLPGPEFDYAAVGVAPDWPHHASGFAAHWNKNSNLGAAFDQWFLNLFSRPKPFVANEGGYLTLSFIPTLGTMVLGLIAGGWLRGNLSAQMRMKRLILAGVACLVLGAAVHWLGLCPLVKRIWTPSWTLFSGGLCFLFMAAFHGVIDLRGWKAWSFPLVVIGMNSIAAYCLAHLIDAFIANSLKTHLGPEVFKLFGNTFAPMVQGTAILLVLWLILYWMYRRKLFLKI
jgi:heparan-alpha-glucosaminide N-acetyltransferase